MAFSSRFVMMCMRDDPSKTLKIARTELAAQVHQVTHELEEPFELTSAFIAVVLSTTAQTIQDADQDFPNDDSSIDECAPSVVKRALKRLRDNSDEPSLHRSTTEREPAVRKWELRSTDSSDYYDEITNSSGYNITLLTPVHKRPTEPPSSTGNSSTSSPELHCFTVSVINQIIP